jgi:starch-binding outer membrane protein, SusD/RagB family
MAFTLFSGSGCEKYLQNTQLPAGTIAGDDAFVSDNSVSAIVTGNFLSLCGSGAFSGGTASNTGFLTGLYTDELKPIATSNKTAIAFYTNAITNDQSSYWSNLYSKIYAVNAAIEGIESTPATLYNKNQWLGESYFTRALLYFTLVNFYGDAPLALTTNYQVNSALARAPQTEVYQQIIKDLKQAQALLGADYKDGYGTTTTARVRPNKAVATALLAKVYLYTKDWPNAEAEATAILTNPAYRLSDLTQTFIDDNGSNKETIWAIANKNDERAYEYGFYNGGMPATVSKEPATYNVLAAISDTLVRSFKPGDRRFTYWVRSTLYTGVTPNITYYFPNKYRSSATGAERSVYLRMAELFLIRAEARAQRSNLSGAVSDIDSVRLRAGLPVTTANTQTILLVAIA